jgi:hypothetical protein
LEITRLAAEARNIAIRKEELFILRLGFPTCHMAHAMKCLVTRVKWLVGNTWKVQTGACVRVDLINSLHIYGVPIWTALDAGDIVSVRSLGTRAVNNR